VFWKSRSEISNIAIQNYTAKKTIVAVVVVVLFKKESIDKTKNTNIRSVLLQLTLKEFHQSQELQQEQKSQPALPRY
jgi:hypothetical protein